MGQSLSLSQLAIIVPNKKLVIQNLQIKAQERKASVKGAFSGVRIGILS